MSDRIEELEARVQKLEQRVSSLEGEQTTDTYAYQSINPAPQQQVNPSPSVPPVPPQAAPQQKPPHPGPAPMFYEGMEKKPEVQPKPDSSHAPRYFSSEGSTGLPRANFS